MTVRWGIIGCGNVTEVKSGPGFQNAIGSALAMVMRRDAAQAEDYAKRHSVPKWTTDANALIHDSEVDAIYVATPPGTHLDYALRIAAAGKPAYIEKPMARNHGECRRMVEAFEQAKQPLFVAFYRRRLPRFLMAKELVDAGRLGQVTLLTYRYNSKHKQDLDPDHLPWRYLAEHSGGGLLLDVGCHALDIFDFILGPITQVHGAASNRDSKYGVEDVVAMQGRFAGGALGVCSWNFVSTFHDDTIEITGSEGKLTLSVFGNEPVCLETVGGTERFDLPNPAHIQQPFIQSIVDQLHGGEACPSTGKTALRTALVMDQVLAEYYGGRDDAFWARPASWSGRKMSGEQM